MLAVTMAVQYKETVRSVRYLECSPHLVEALRPIILEYIRIRVGQTVLSVQLKWPSSKAVFMVKGWRKILDALGLQQGDALEFRKPRSPSPWTFEVHRFCSESASSTPASSRRFLMLKSGSNAALDCAFNRL